MFYKIASMKNCKIGNFLKEVSFKFNLVLRRDFFSFETCLTSIVIFIVTLLLLSIYSTYIIRTRKLSYLVFDKMCFIS